MKVVHREVFLWTHLFSAPNSVVWKTFKGVFYFSGEKLERASPPSIGYYLK
ncbi:hypothetical protein CSE_04870 [Caldisericum exile AZM16c01]|uniref:Uncharacterized protein n=1 Tax=Caldisericum exile (strain DSM 21853 / NBRC 104410 / AZM16c01) TaxID=511051 RepID=A0A7U6JEM0_CALEA|nr:hypothetical protein CSE_04870 [Caldisericum exile AZM16c01]